MAFQEIGWKATSWGEGINNTNVKEFLKCVNRKENFPKISQQIKNLYEKSTLQPQKFVALGKQNESASIAFKDGKRGDAKNACSLEEVDSKCFIVDFRVGQEEEEAYVLFPAKKGRMR